jgi:hypothetical protein
MRIARARSAALAEPAEKTIPSRHGKENFQGIIMKFFLSIHPVFQFTAILLGYYAGYLGLQRTLILHFGRPSGFQRDRHALAGAAA